MSTERPVWGWTRPSRGLLAVALATAALGLLVGTLAARREADGPPDFSLRVDPNTAPPRVLLALPALGPTRVGRLIAEREAAPFASLDDLRLRVRGIGPATAAAIGPSLRFDGDPPAGGLLPDPPGSSPPS